MDKLKPRNHPLSSSEHDKAKNHTMNLKPLLFLSAILLLGSCKKDDPAIQYPEGWEAGVQTSAGVRKFLATMAPLEQVTIVNPATGQTIITDGGTRLYIPAENFKDENDKPLLTGSITVNVQEYFSNKDLLTGYVSTTTEQTDVLHTSGALHVTLADNKNNKVRMRGSVTVTIPGRGTYDPANQLFSGRVRTTANLLNTNPNIVLWQNDTSILREINRNYQFVLTNDSWWNIAGRLADSGKGMGSIQVKLPAGYGNKNTMVAIIVPGTGVVQLAADPENATFVSLPYQLPVGTAIKLLCLAQTDIHTYAYDYSTITVDRSTDLTIQSLKTANESAIKTLINTGL